MAMCGLQMNLIQITHTPMLGFCFLGFGSKSKILPLRTSGTRV